MIVRGGRRLTPVPEKVAFVVPEPARFDPQNARREQTILAFEDDPRTGEPVDAASIGHSKEDRVIRAA